MIIKVVMLAIKITKKEILFHGYASHQNFFLVIVGLIITYISY